MCSSDLISSSLGTDLVDSGNAESLARSLFLVRSRCAGIPHRTSICIVPNLTALQACRTCLLSYRPRRGANGGSLTSVGCLWSSLWSVRSWALSSSWTSWCTLGRHVVRENTTATLPLGNGLPLHVSQLNTLVLNS